MSPKHFLIKLGLVILLMILSIASYFDKQSKIENAYEQGYQEGSQHTTELLKELAQAPEITDEQAVQWWTGTKDMVAVRDRLCGKSKPKKEGK